MPRMQRLFFPGCLVHIMARGIDGKSIFNSDEDKLEFLDRFSNIRQQVGYLCNAWCLMDNHYHLLMRLNELPISTLMRPLNGGYARWYNKKYNRRGYLFQDRYKSVLCQEQEYARQLIRYIHLNPLRAGVVQSLKELQFWRWCGHGYLAGHKRSEGRTFQDRQKTLVRFGKSESDGMKNYLKYLNEAIVGDSLSTAGLIGIESEIEIAGSQKGWPSVIGDPEFVKNAMEKHSVGNVRKHRKADYAYVLETIRDTVCAKYSVEKKEIFIRGRECNRSFARSEFCFRANKIELIPFSVIAEYLNLSIPSVANLVRNRDMKCSVSAGAKNSVNF